MRVPVLPSVTPRNRDSRDHHARPDSRPRSAWAGRLAVMASRGETEGPRVDEARRALSWHRLNAAVRAEVDTGYLTEADAQRLIDQLPGSETR